MLMLAREPCVAFSVPANRLLLCPLQDRAVSDGDLMRADSVTPGDLRGCDSDDCHEIRLSSPA
jgi:hypothetical protein